MKSALPYQQAMRRSVAAIVVANLMWCGAPPAFASEAASTVSGADEEVTITSGSKRTVFEYRHNGQLRAIKIVPSGGKPYYLVPADPTQGVGDLEHSGKLVPSWRIVEF